ARRYPAMFLRGGRGATSAMSRRVGRGPALLLRSGRRAAVAISCHVGWVEPFCCAAGEVLPLPLLATSGGWSLSPAQREKGCRCHFLPRRAGRALLLRSGRRWRAAPDEGASEASCCCSSGQRQSQRHASLRSRSLIRPPLSRGQALRAPSPVN